MLAFSIDVCHIPLLRLVLACAVFAPAAGRVFDKRKIQI